MKMMTAIYSIMLGVFLLWGTATNHDDGVNAFAPSVQLRSSSSPQPLLLRKPTANSGGLSAKIRHLRQPHTRLLYRTSMTNNETEAAAMQFLPKSSSFFTTNHGSNHVVTKQQVVVSQQPLSHRFERTANATAQAEQPCILTIDGVRYNVTSWAKAHPGGFKVLQKFHGKDATQAFVAAHHSAEAIKMLQQFVVVGPDETVKPETITTTTTMATVWKEKKRIPRWRAKLFTKEDKIGVHKYMGVFVLLHFLFRHFQMFFTDPSAGLGTRLGKGPSWIPILCLLPHGLLSLSSLIFHTVPKDRVVGKPMIWQEFRVHNIAFGLRSVITAALAAMSIHYGNTPTWRKIAVWGSSITCLITIMVADLGTKYLRPSETESTTATMPYWEGCSVQTQKRFKSFYAYCQFLASLGCLSVSNPAWPLSILLAIQLASLLMTLVRKGLLSTRGYHYLYTAALVTPYVVALRSMVYMKTADVLGVFALGGALYQLRRRGVNKYVLWLPIIAARIAIGDQYLNWHVW